MAKSYEGFISIFENGSWGGAALRNPQALPVEFESLGVNQDIRFRDSVISDGRAYNAQSSVHLGKSPSGAIAYSFRPDDCAKVFYSHFQRGTMTGGTKYTFYPSLGKPDFESGQYPDGSYQGSGYVYSVSILKRLTPTGTNAQLFKNGVCDTLQIAWSANEEARLNADFKFLSVDTGTAWSGIPNGTESGTYSSQAPLHAHYGTLTYAGGAIELEQVTLNLKNNLEVMGRVGARNAEAFRFGRYEVSGDLGLDLPPDGFKYLGSMLGTRSFSLSMDMRTSGTSFITFSLPNCFHKPFEINANGINSRLKLPFVAFGTGTLPPIQVEVYTTYEDLFWDASANARTLLEYEIIDAAYGARTLSEYEIVDRDL